MMFLISKKKRDKNSNIEVLKGKRNEILHPVTSSCAVNIYFRQALSNERWLWKKNWLKKLQLLERMGFYTKIGNWLPDCS